jgi:methyltransferase (TIGR00027 family)
VALLRALGDRGHSSLSSFRDSTAHAMLSPGWSRVLAWVEPKLRLQSSAMRRESFRYLDMIPLCTLAIDGELIMAVERGCAHVVILGAGLDGRAYRMLELAGAHVFEVDHPDTQRLKRQRVAPLVPTCRELTFVAVDFERDSLQGRLRDAGHRADQPSVWICEGVTQYLADDALRAMLQAMAACSCPDSRLLIEYHDIGQPTSSWLAQRMMLRLWSEPHIGLRSPAQMRALVEAAGFAVESDSSGSDWTTMFGAAVASPVVKRQRLLVACVLRA